jgi:hypothetical protein
VSVPVGPPAEGGEPLAEPAATGEPQVDAALTRLQDVTNAPVEEHVAIYDEVHRRLQDALADPDGG